MFIQMEMFKSIQAFVCERHAYLKQGQQKMATTSSARRSLGRQTTAAPSVRGRAGGRRRRPLPLSPSTTPSTPSPSSTTTRTGLLGLGGRLGRKSPLPAGVVLASGDEDTDDVVEFGYNRKDVLILCTLPLVGGYLAFVNKSGGIRAHHWDAAPIMTAALQLYGQAIEANSGETLLQLALEHRQN